MSEKATITANHIRDVFQRYVELVTQGDFEAIALLYAEDATVEDPVGSTPHRGRAAIRDFYRLAAGAVRLELEGRVRVAGREGAAAMIARPTADDRMVVETLDVMTFDNDGLITSMRAYWSPDSIYRTYAVAGRADDIRIVDLARPVLTAEQQAAIEAARRLPVSLTEDAVFAAARQRTGLSDFGDDRFRARLRVWLQAADEDTDLGPLGRATVFGNCVRLLANRLRLEDFVKQHPEILDIEIKQPIIIAGLPRSGTTHLVNLISADPRLRSLPFWESLEPFPAPDDVAGPDGRDPRLVRCRQSYERQDRLLPLLRAMHHMTPEHVHEEIEVQELDFATYNLEWYARVPRWRDFYLSADLRPSYAYLKKALQALQWLRGPDRWVLKSPQHMEQLEPLVETFPDATVVLTHRDPVQVIQSAITMVAYGARLRRTRIDLDDIATYWIDRIERLLRACVRDRDRLPASQSLDVLFHEFMADDIGTVARIYELAGLPMNADTRGRLEAFMLDNPRGKYGRVLYDLRSDFGVDPGEVRRRFAFYLERFPVRVEEVRGG